MKSIFLLIVSSILILAVFSLLKTKTLSNHQVVNTPYPTHVVLSTPILPSPLPQLIYIKNVPFSSQAPYGDWKDARQQDGCEEAASMLAIAWANNQTLTKDQALETLLAIADFEKNTYGQFTDTSTSDTQDRIIRNYFHYSNSQVISINFVADIITQLSQNKLVIIPTNGQLLNNPNFTGNGPERHNLVIRGYDSTTKEFITNDPGTRKGENYRYPENVIFNAIRDYPTGAHEPITTIQKNAIVVWK